MITPQELDQAEAAAKDFASTIELEYYDSRQPIDIQPLQDILTTDGMKAYQIVPLALDGTNLTIGIASSTDRANLESIKGKMTGYTVTFKFMSDIGWTRLLNRYSVGGYDNALESGDFDFLNEKLANLEPKAMFDPIVQVAYQLGTSDIHIEPGESTARLRFRVDGVLHPIITLPKDRYDLLTSDLQMRAGVKWGADVPQGGRISVNVIDKYGDIAPVNMRLETIPSLHGQDVVIRLFSMSAQFVSLANLSLSADETKRLVKAAKHPQGMILTVGPTGSGKTSTLYSIINELNSPEVKIVTLEDPVEYELEGISQVPVHSEDRESFMDKLRAVLREDPNIIMIGEIRDADTAKTALQAALTGHLVLSTFHAASGATAVTRLMDMIGQNPLLASALHLIMAQRLIRRLCPDCRQTYTPSHEELLQIKAALKGLPTGSHPAYDELTLAKPVGCDKCHHFGYRGRLSLVEQLEVTEKTEDLIGHGTAATTSQAIEEAAIAQGMITLLQDGVLKAVAGETTLEEVFVAVGE